LRDCPAREAQKMGVESWDDSDRLTHRTGNGS
jgi:hypothetical protein